MSNVKIVVEEAGRMSEFTIDGRDMLEKQSVIAISLDHRATDDFPRLIVEYGCFEQMTIEGGMEVVHVCPKKAR